MQQRTINFLKMTSGVIAGMESEKQVWEAEKEIVGVYTGIVAEYNKIENTNQGILGTNTTGYTDEKDNLFDSITFLTFKLCSKMSGYAKLKKDYTLLPLVDHSLSALQRGIEKEAVDRCAAIADRATVMLPLLTKYKVTEAQLTAIKQHIKEFKTSLNGKKTTSGNLTVSAEEISASVALLREKFDALDSLVDGMIEDEGFISRYKSWRRITDYGRGKTLPNKKK